MGIINNILEKIERDITDRSGIGNEWENIDDDIREESQQPLPEGRGLR